MTCIPVVCQKYRQDASSAALFCFAGLFDFRTVVVSGRQTEHDDRDPTPPPMHA